MNQENIIQFILDGEIKTIDFSTEKNLKPTTTVLNYLRSLPTHKGVKEGCAEGDCGACTIAIAEPGWQGGLKYKALDSCLLFLPMIHGKQIITVENLAIRESNDIKLHPVQQLMVDLNGAQCGYCTPGIIMSLFTLYKNHNNPTREIAEDALTGNLCRCTGYQPILDAALKACVNNGIDQFTQHEKETEKTLLDIIGKQTSVIIDCGEQKYFRPGTIKEALEIRQKFPDAIIINGATDVALRQTKKHEKLPIILDLSGAGDLKYFDDSTNTFRIGAGLNIECLKQAIQDKLPELNDILKVFASLQIRNIATIGGNVGSASPIGDTLPLLFAYGAIIEITGSNGKREMAIEDFITGYRAIDLKSDELITGIFIPKPEKETILKTYKISKRKDLDISTVSCGFKLIKDSTGTIKEIILAYGGMAEKTKRAVNCENFLKGKEWTRSNVEAAMEYISKDFTPISDARAGKEFRTIAAKNLLLKLFSETAN